MSRAWRVAAAGVLTALALTLAALVYLYAGAINNVEPLGSLPPEGRIEAPALSASPQSAPRRTVVVIVDGLREDTSRQMPFVESLRGEGADLSALAPTPSLSRPAYAAMFAGAPPERTGLRSNRYDEPVVVDTLLAQAHRGERRVVAVADHPYLEDNHGEAFDAFHQVAPGDDDALVEAAGGAIADEADLILLHAVDVDRAGHAHGVGPDYLEAARRLDATIERVAGDLDLSQDLIVVTADHGHRPGGGHGGDEEEVRRVPLVMAGHGVRAGSSGAAPVQLPQLAPTLSVLLGLPYPADLSTPPIAAVLDGERLGEPYIAARQREWREHRRRYEAAWLASTREAWSQQGRFENPVVEAAAVPDGATLETLMGARRTTLDAIHEHRVLGRAPLIALILAVLGLFAFVGLVRGNRRAPMLAAPLFPAVALAAWWALGLPLTWSAVSTWTTFLGTLAAVCALATLTYAGALEWLLRRSDPRHVAEARLFHVALAALLYAGGAFSLWLASGFAVDAPMPGATFLFLPIWWGGAAVFFLASAVACVILVGGRGEALQQAEGGG